MIKSLWVSDEVFHFEKRNNFDNSICTGRSKTEYFELIIFIVLNIKDIPYEIFSVSEIKLNHRNMNIGIFLIAKKKV